MSAAAMMVSCGDDGMEYSMAMSEAFSAHTATLLEQAAAACAKRGTRLTELRREVLGLILEAPGPTGAYDLLDRLRARRGTAAPPTVYRALEFLQDQGFVHRIQSLSAFVGCVEEHGHRHPAQFLICRICGRAIEIEDHGLARALDDAAAKVGFAVSGATIEAVGVCAACRKEGK
jgi:Fur family zinc uptake transcriptional regulator